MTSKPRNTGPQAMTEVGIDDLAETAEKAVTEEETESRALAEMVPEIMSGSTFDEDTLRSLSSFDDALALMEREYGTVVDAADEMGDGFTLLDREQKERLIGLPMMLLEWRFRAGDFGDTPFCSLRAVVRYPNGSMGKYIINDGSAGIAEQLAKYTKKTGRSGGIIAKRGLRRSDYQKDIDGVTINATTIYIDLSKDE